MGFDEVWIFGEVDSFECETSETFSSVHSCLFLLSYSSTSKSRACSILIVHDDSLKMILFRMNLAEFHHPSSWEFLYKNTLTLVT